MGLRETLLFESQESPEQLGRDELVGGLRDHFLHIIAENATNEDPLATSDGSSDVLSNSKNFEGKISFENVVASLTKRYSLPEDEVERFFNCCLVIKKEGNWNIQYISKDVFVLSRAIGNQGYEIYISSAKIWDRKSQNKVERKTLALKRRTHTYPGLTTTHDPYMGGHAPDRDEPNDDDPKY